MLEAIVLAGGMGTRLRAVVPDLPKPMAPVAGKPFLEILLGSLALKGFYRVILSTGYMEDKIRGYFGETFCGMQLVYSNETKSMGTGGAIKLAMKYVEQDHVYILNGDTYINIDIAKLEKIWERFKCSTVVGVNVEDVSRYGAINQKNGFLESFSEKGEKGPGIINAGCYILSADFSEKFQEDVFSFEEWVMQNSSHFTFKLFISNERFIDIGIPEDYCVAQNFIFK